MPARPRRAHRDLDTPTKVRRKQAPAAELESAAKPQPGKAALRSVRFPACRFWRLSSRQMVAVSRCTPAQYVFKERGLQSAAFWHTENRGKRTKVCAPILPEFA